MEDRKETCEKKSISIRESYQNGRKIPPNVSGWGKGGWYNSILQGNIWLRSQGEIKYAEFLDNHNISWVYENEFFRMTHNSKKTIYRPDFYLIDYDIYIDIKGYFTPEKASKIHSFREQYPNIHLDLLFYEDLRNWNIKI